MSTIRSTRKTEISSNQDSFLFLVFFKAVTLKKEKATMKVRAPIINIPRFIILSISDLENSFYEYVRLGDEFFFVSSLKNYEAGCHHSSPALPKIL